MRANTFHRKQSIYRAIEAEARMPRPGTVLKKEITAPPAPDPRTAIEIARAAAQALNIR